MTELVADILRFDGHDVETANSGKRALELIAQNDFDVILSDLRMPGLDGPTLFRHLEESRPELVSCIAFITGDTLSTDIHQFLKSSQRPYLEKTRGTCGHTSPGPGDRRAARDLGRPTPRCRSAAETSELVNSVHRLPSHRGRFAGLDIDHTICGRMPWRSALKLLADKGVSGPSSTVLPNCREGRVFTWGD